MQHWTPAGVVPGLALTDLRHEWILTLCLVLALAAVIAPLLLLMGLKYGTIATLRDRLLQDPVYREIRPAQTREYPPRWFDQLKAREEVSFLTPTILPASSIISVVHPGSQRTELLDLIPTAAGDPLILENGGRVPGPQQCVLTTAAAEELGLSEGDHLEVRVTRSRAGRREFGEARLQIASVLQRRAGGLPRMYAPLPFVLDVEAYKEGLAIPSRGWAGGTPRPYLSFDGIIVVLPERLRPVEESGLIINTGLTSIKRMGGAAFRKRTGFPLPSERFAYDLAVLQGPVQPSSYRAVKDKLRGRGSVLLPYAAPGKLTLAGQRLPVFGLSVSSTEASALGLPELPWGPLQADAPPEKLRQILLPDTEAEPQDLVALAGGTQGALSFPLRYVGNSPGDYGLVPVELIGTLRTAMQRGVLYDAERETFLLARSGFRGFRLYARSIDDVVPLARELKQQGIDVIAQVEAIERIRILDHGLTRIFWLVAVVGISGGIAALIASLYAAVERKRRDLSVMRLIGLSRRDVFRFPLYQGGAIAAMSVAAATLGYFTLAGVINRVFATDLELGQKICLLPASYLLAAGATTVTVALMSALFAAWRTTQIDPAEALREE